MSTKVKGQAIKDGSIPLSALSKEIKDKIDSPNKKIVWENIQYSPFSISGGATGNCGCTFLKDENNYHYYLVTAYDNYIIQIVKSDSGFTKYHDPLKKGYFILLMSDDAQRPDCQIDIVSTIYDGTDYKVTIKIKNTEKEWLDVEGIDIISVLESTTYSLNKSFIPQLPAIYVESDNPNWNAKEGEPGYIKNRTHYHYNTLKFKYNGRDDRYETDYISPDEGVIYIEDVSDWNRKYEIPTIETSEDGQSGYDWSNALTISFWDVSEEYYGIFSVGYDIDNSKVVAIYNANEADVDYDSRIKNMNIFNVVQIESEFIPDTVIKTTPQTLSDTDKNQALANLGIDPVVWKYICNPCIIKYGEKVPEELIGEYSDDVGSSGGYYLKYPNLAMYKIIFTNNRIDSEYGEASVIITPSGISEYGVELTDIHISKDYGVYTGDAHINEDKNWASM